MKKLEKLGRRKPSFKRQRKIARNIKAIVDKMLPATDQTGDLIEDEKISNAYARGQLMAFGCTGDTEEEALEKFRKKQFGPKIEMPTTEQHVEEMEAPTGVQFVTPPTPNKLEQKTQTEEQTRADYFNSLPEDNGETWEDTLDRILKGDQ